MRPAKAGFEFVGRSNMHCCMIDEDEKSFHYFLGDPQEHCGEPKKVLKSFATEAEAEIVKRQVMSLITEKGTTEGLPLIELCDTGLN